MHIYPGNAVGLGSSTEDLEIARNTVRIHAMAEKAVGEYDYKRTLEAGEKVKDPHFYKAGAFNASNLSCLFFTAAVRVGYDPDVIWNEMHEMIQHRGISNGFIEENPHGIEQLNTIPDAVQEMMLQSYEGILRIFPVWPKINHPNASFRGFRAWGAFEVSASMQNGIIECVSVVSHKGHICCIQNPWGKDRIRIVRSCRDQELFMDGEILHIPLYREEEAVLTKA